MLISEAGKELTHICKYNLSVMHVREREAIFHHEQIVSYRRTLLSHLVNNLMSGKPDRIYYACSEAEEKSVSIENNRFNSEYLQIKRCMF